MSKQRRAEDEPASVNYQPGQPIDHYTIVKLLGQGSDSTVYLARDEHDQREVVLKIPHVEEPGSADVFARSQREVAIGKRLANHPGIQRHLYSDEPRSKEYLVLEYLRGRTLREELHERAPELLPVDEALRVVLAVVETLLFVHKQGVIHRDLKPENILLLDDGGVALFDFGIAHWQGERWLRLRGFSRPIGTPAYMAPELLRAKAGTVQSDIYAVGVLLYELLCGHTPFQEHNAFDFLTEHISHDPPALLDQNPAVEPALATVVMRAIRRDSGQRYASVKVFSEDLSQLDRVKPQPYVPNAPLVGGRFRPVLNIALLILIIFLVIIAFGILAQFAHPAGLH
jgi:eukaryotic-like serine/threonine-protein kinase